MVTSSFQRYFNVEKISNHLDASVLRIEGLKFPKILSFRDYQHFFKCTTNLDLRVPAKTGKRIPFQGLKILGRLLVK